MSFATPYIPFTESETTWQKDTFLQKEPCLSRCPGYKKKQKKKNPSIGSIFTNQMDAYNRNGNKWKICLPCDVLPFFYQPLCRRLSTHLIWSPFPRRHCVSRQLLQQQQRRRRRRRRRRPEEQPEEAAALWVLRTLLHRQRRVGTTCAAAWHVSILPLTSNPDRPSLCANANVPFGWPRAYACNLCTAPWLWFNIYIYIVGWALLALVYCFFPSLC